MKTTKFTNSMAIFPPLLYFIIIILTCEKRYGDRKPSVQRVGIHAGLAGVQRTVHTYHTEIQIHTRIENLNSLVEIVRSLSLYFVTICRVKEIERPSSCSVLPFGCSQQQIKCDRILSEYSKTSRRRMLTFLQNMIYLLN